MQKWPTRKGLQRYLFIWQHLLRLTQWRITIDYARSRDLIVEDGSTSWGRVAMNENNLKAEIYVLHPDDYKDDEGRNEIEATVVHELLHISVHPSNRRLEGLDQLSEGVALEQHLNILADLLVGLRRASVRRSHEASTAASRTGPPSRFDQASPASKARNKEHRQHVA